MAVAIGADLGYAYGVNGGANCWLKESVGPVVYYKSGRGKPAAIAVLEG